MKRDTEVLEILRDDDLKRTARLRRIEELYADDLDDELDDDVEEDSDEELEDDEE